MPATDEYWRSLPRMHRWFAVSAIVLLAATLLMMYKDESRSWKEYQAQAEVYRVDRINEQISEFESPEYQERFEAAKAKYDAAEQEFEAQAANIGIKQEELTRLQGQVQILQRDSKARNAERDKARADYDIAVRDERPAAVLSEYRSKFEDAEEIAKAKAVELERAQAAYNELGSEIGALRTRLDEAEAELNLAQADRVALEEQRELIRPRNTFAWLKRNFKELPIINGFNPHLRIQYDWAADLEQTLGMVSVSRVDRCRTCHVNIAEFGAGNVPNYPADKYSQPFCSHPDPDLFLTATSPHPVTSFGCTICHEGDGSGTAFQTAEHTPPNPAVAEHWEEEHHWHSNHYWEYPMFPKQFIESSCLRCHPNVVELGVNKEYGASAPQLYEGFSLIREYGCFGCHEINGFDGSTPIGPDMRLEPQTAEELAKYEADPNMIPGKMRKVGPSLRHIDTKTTPEFIAYWTREPKRFRPDTRMPQFFDLTNQHDAMAEIMQPIELTAISTYLMEKSQPLELLSPREGYTPDPERGLDLFKKRGCLACHSRSGEEFVGIDADFGPDLSRINEKLKAGEEGFQWLYTWIKEPTRYHLRTKMPDLFLDPVENGDTYIDPAADIAAYLLQGGPSEFPPLTNPQAHLGLTAAEDFSLNEALALGLTEEEYRGVLINEVIQGSPASRAESQNRDGEWSLDPIQIGDVLISLNGQNVSSDEQLAQLQSSFQPQSVVSAVIYRNGQEMTYRMTVSTPLDDLVRLYLSKSMPQARVNAVFENRGMAVTEDMYKEEVDLAEFIKGDEIELAPLSFGEDVTDEEWERRKMVYVGRRTISRYGCYGCHDIPEFESARPIGTALQDWGRKDTSKLAYEHIHEFLHHHGDPNGGSIGDRLTRAVKEEANNPGSVPEQELFDAAMYKSVISHGRAGFLWQKLRQPRSYDYRKTETKGWDERLRMPKFPFDSEDIEAVSTFVLGLVADPPPPSFMYRPSGPAGDIIEGERLLTKYNCAGCHMLEMPSWEFGVEPDMLPAIELVGPDKAMYDHFGYIKPAQKGWTGENLPSGEPVLKATGYAQRFPDPEEDPEFQMYSFVLWDPIRLEDGRMIMPGQPMPVSVPMLKSQDPGRGGELAEWLVKQLPGNEPGVNDVNEARQAAPPPLVKEGYKVQTPWLYQFLKNPEQLRFTTVLRMPKFNMDDAEAQSLANYFAAVDKAPYPYQSIPERQAEYQREQAIEYQHEYPNAQEDFMTASWLALNGPLCRKCHTVGGNVVTEVDPSQVKRGPNLQRVQDRMRSDFTRLWVYNPKWILPYTSMPQNFPPGAASAMPELFGGDNVRQAEAVVDALFNYTKLMELHGETTYLSDDPAAAPTAAAAPETSGSAADTGASE